MNQKNIKIKYMNLYSDSTICEKKLMIKSLFTKLWKSNY